MIKRIINKMFFIFNEKRRNARKKRIKKFKDLHKGERCFIIGNGPSLRVEDLEKLNNEICFGTHRIYNLFEKTKWRPLYYCAQDIKLINESYKEINDMKLKNKFIAVVKDVRYKKLNAKNFIELKYESFYPELPKFSEDISECIYEGFTVTYMCLQIAVYMGFKEIYLLGVDHTYSQSINPDGTIQINKNIKDHFYERGDVMTYLPQTYRSTLGYRKARQYADSHNIKIFNATRGGALEEFERIDFDEIKFR